jgi:hypothetical protein
MTIAIKQMAASPFGVVNPGCSARGTCRQTARYAPSSSLNGIGPNPPPAGRRNLLLVGFSGYLLVGIIIFAAWDKLIAIIPLFVIFFAIFTSSGNFGPGKYLILALIRR